MDDALEPLAVVTAGEVHESVHGLALELVGRDGPDGTLLGARHAS